MSSNGSKESEDKNKKCVISDSDSLVIVKECLDDIISKIPFVEVEFDSNYEHKVNLVLDLDETLIHCIFNPKFAITKDNLLTTLTFDSFKGYVYYRPFLFDFLEQVEKHFNIILFTMGVKDYAEPIISEIHKKYGRTIFKKIIARKKQFDDSIGKSLKPFKLNTANSIVVDDRSDFWPNDIMNLIRINPFHGPEEMWLPFLLDQELRKMGQIVIEIQKGFLEQMRFCKSEMPSITTSISTWRMKSIGLGGFTHLNNDADNKEFDYRYNGFFDLDDDFEDSLDQMIQHNTKMHVDLENEKEDFFPVNEVKDPPDDKSEKDAESNTEGHHVGHTVSEPIFIVTTVTDITVSSTDELP